MYIYACMCIKNIYLLNMCAVQITSAYIALKYINIAIACFYFGDHKDSRKYFHILSLVFACSRPPLHHSKSHSGTLFLMVRNVLSLAEKIYP